MTYTEKSTNIEKPRPLDPTYRGQRRAAPPRMGPLLCVFDGQPLADVPEVAAVVGRVLAAAEDDQRAADRLAVTLRDSGGVSLAQVADLEMKLRGHTPILTGIHPMQISGVSSTPPRPHGIPVVAPTTTATSGDVIGFDVQTGTMMSRVRDPRGQWRCTMVGNFPSGSKKAKAKLARLPRRYKLVLGFARDVDADSFGGCELGTAFWQVLEDRPGWRGHRGLANSAVGSNRIGNGNVWRASVYRCLDRAHFTIPGLPSGEFDQLDIPVVLLEDKDSGAIHAEITIHNFARRYSKPWERRKVVAAIIKLVNCLTDAGIPVILRGDFNDSIAVTMLLEDETELRKVAPDDRSIDMIFASPEIQTRQPEEIGKDDHPKLRRATDHRSVTLVWHRVPVDDTCPRELPRLPRIRAVAVAG